MAVMVTQAHVAKNVRRATMQTQEVVEAMTRSKVDKQTFFRLAHIYCFGSDANVSTDVAQFKLHAIVPPFVLRYVRETSSGSTS